MARISFLSSLLFFITALVSSTSMMVMAFTVSPLPTSSSLATSSFAHRTVEQTYGNTPSTATSYDRKSTIRMGKIAKFGIFSPAVVAAKAVLGEKELNKVRGKAISLHSQAITDFCKYVGAQGKMRARIIKKAKTNGDDLGFLW